MHSLKPLLAAALIVVPSAALATVTQLSDFNDFTSTVRVSETGFDIATSGAWNTNGSPAYNENGVVAGVARWPESLEFTFTGANEIGMLFGNDQDPYGAFFDATLSVFAGATFIGSVVVASNGNDLTDQFIGLRSDTAFTRASLDYVTSGASKFIGRLDLGLVSVPEPGTLVLLGLGLAGLGLSRRRKAN